MRVDTVLRWYPPAWRDRYETEMTAVLEQHQVTLATWVDLLRGMLDARLDPAFGGRMGSVAARLRRSEIVVFCSFVAFVVAGMGFQKMTEDADKAGVMQSHLAVGVGYYAVIIGAIVAALAVVAGGAPIGLSVLRQALSGRRLDIFGLLAVPVVMGLAVIGWGSYVGHQHQTLTAGVRSMIVFAMVAIALSAAAVSLAVSRADLTEATVRFARIPALVAGLGMALSLGGVILWGLSLRASAPSFYALNGGALQSYAYFTWVRVVAVMGLSMLMALIALWRMSGSSHQEQLTA